MNAIKILAETPDSVTISRKDWTDLLAGLEDVEDRATVAERRAYENLRGKDLVRRDYLTVDETLRLLEGENPIKLWREKRGLSQRQLAAAANISPSYLAEIERGRKPGSTDAISKLSQMLSVPKEDLMSELQRIRAPEFGPVLVKWRPYSAGVSPGNRGAGPEVKRFSTLREALDDVKKDWQTLRNQCVSIETQDGKIIYDLDRLFQENEPDVWAILQQQSRL